MRPVLPFTIPAGRLPAKIASLSRLTPAKARVGRTPVGPKERWSWRTARPGPRVSLPLLAGGPAEPAVCRAGQPDSERPRADMADRADRAVWPDTAYRADRAGKSEIMNH